MGKTIIGVVIASLIVGGVVFYFQSQPAQAPTENATLPPPANDAMMKKDDATIDKGGSMMDENSSMMEKSVSIEITSSGFSPQTTAIKAGTKVTWINKTTNLSWPATAIHPTHTIYPGSDVKKCGTSEAGKIFDACHDLKPGESYSFVFNEKGTWAYHDHLHSGRFGKITVE